MAVNWTEQDLRDWQKRNGQPISSLFDIKEPEITKTTRSQGRRADLGDRYFRSTWEANIARYLNWLKSVGAVVAWEYETEEFEFHTIKRGNRFYRIDFKIWFTIDPVTPVYWEVKGYMDATSKTKLTRMARYYPHIRIEVIGHKQYAEIRRNYRHVISNWEEAKAA